MGSEASRPQVNFEERFRKGVKAGPDLKVNRSICKFSGLTTTEGLRQHFEKRRMEAGGCAADWIKNLAEKLTAFTSAPELAGLGALAVAVLIDILSASPPEESIKEALRTVLAEEKALTRLKNSIVKDGHVTNQAVKIWVNGAAFHIQMLIHLERLGGTRNCDPIKSLIKDYKEDLDAVFKKHKAQEMIKGKCRVSCTTPYIPASTMNYRMVGDCHASCPIEIPDLTVHRFLVDDEGEDHLMESGSFDKYFSMYYDEKYYKQKREIQIYFSDVEEKVPELVRHTGSLDLR